MKSLAVILIALLAPGLLHAGNFPVADLVLIEKGARKLLEQEIEPKLFPGARALIASAMFRATPGSRSAAASRRSGSDA